MTRYTSRRPPPPKNETHAIWRGIGCLLLLIVPIIAWLLAKATVGLALISGWPLPYQLLGYPVIPEGLWNIRAVVPVLAFISRQQHLYLTLTLAIAYIVVISAVLSFVYAVIYRVVGPPRYGPLDLPQPQVKIGRYKR